MKLSDKYYSGIEVQRKLGITEPALRNLVNQGKIKKIIPPGRKYGVYLKAEIDRFAEKWEAFLMAKEPPKTVFLIPSTQDMEDENELDRKTVGGAGMTAEVRKAWLSRVPELDYHVRHDGKLVAFLRILPLKEKTLNAFMNGEIRGRNITPDDLETLEPGKDIKCIIIGASRDQDVDENTGMHYMLVLLRGAARELKALGRRGIHISKLYATSESPTGIAMALHVGMHDMPPNIGKRVRFELDVDTSSAFLAQAYKEGYEEWKKAQRKQATATKR